MAVLLTGLAGIVGQLALLWWLPGNATLAIASFVTAAAVAPLLPLLESSALQAVASTQRTLLLAAAATAASVADLVGTALFGTLASAAGTGGALGVAAVLAGLGLLLALPMANKVLPRRTRRSSTV
jgi:MFS family permease